MKYIVHAGAYKTATSAIQYVANRDREHLQRAGILYPTIGLSHGEGVLEALSSAHHLLFRGAKYAFEEPRRSQDLLEKYVSELESTHNFNIVLLSTELLSGSTIDIKRKFIDLYCDPKNVYIEYAIRAPHDYAESLLNQRIKRFRFPPELISPPFVSDIGHWLDLVGPERVLVSYFSKQNARDFVRDFFSRVGYQFPVGEEVPNVNVAVSVKGAFFRRSIAGLAEDKMKVRRERRRLLLDVQKFENENLSKERLKILGSSERDEYKSRFVSEMLSLAEFLDENGRALLEKELLSSEEGESQGSNFSDEVALSVDELASVIEFARTYFPSSRATDSIADITRTQSRRMGFFQKVLRR